MLLRKLFTNLSLTLRRQSVIGERYCTSKAIKELVQTAEEKPVFLEEEDDEFEQKRNKSRLNPEHRNMLFGEKPYKESMEWYHNTVKYKKRTLGRYGMKALDVPAGLAWPTPEEVEDMKEYEKVAFPLSIQERWESLREKRREREEAIMARQKEIESKMSTMEDVIANVRAKIAKKVAAAEEAKQKKERRLREIRYQIGLTGHVTNEKVDEMLAKLEKEDKKKKKELKKQRMLERQKKLLMKDMPIDQPVEADVNAVEEDTVERGEGSSKSGESIK